MAVLSVINNTVNLEGYVGYDNNVQDLQFTGFNNYIDTYGGNDRITTHTVTNLGLNTGSGNDYVYMSNRATTYATIDLGDNDDYAYLGAVNLVVKADNGNDRYHIESGSVISVSLGFGNKTITTGALGQITISEYYADNSGGSRNIRIQSAASANVSTGRGDDFIEGIGAFSITVNSSGGNNTIIARGAGSSVTTGAGNDTITAHGINTYVRSGGGDDYVSVIAGGADVDTGAGHDTVVLQAIGASVKTGAGNDTAFILAAGASVDLGSGDNTIEFFAIGGSIIVGDGDDTANINVAGASVDLGGGDNTVNFNAIGGTITVGDGNDTINAQVVGAKINTNGGDDFINVNALGAEINAGSGDNVFNIKAGGATLTAGDGDDYALVGAGVGILNLGGGDNYVDLQALGGSVNVGDGNDTISVKVFGASIDAGGGDNHIYAGGFGVSAFTGSGNDAIYSIGVGGQQIDSGNGNDVVHAFGGVNVVSVGHGHNDVTVGGGLNIVQAGYGDNIIRSYGGVNTVLSGHGNNYIDAFGGANIVLTGNGDNEVRAFGGANLVLVGDGKNHVYAAGGGNIIFTGNGGTQENINRTAPDIADLGVNLVTNGSFEAGAESRPATGFTFGTAEGWTIGQATEIEYQINDVLGFDASTGRSYLELATVRGVHASISQDVDTRSDAVYQISVDYRTRSGFSGEDSAIEVLWGGEVVGVLNEANSSEWTTHTFRVRGALDSDSQLELRDAGAGTGAGGLIDNIRVQEVLAFRDSDVLGSPNASAADAPADAFGYLAEAGQLTVEQPDANTWFTVELDNTYTDAVVIFSPLTNNGIDPATIRVRNVTENSFEYQIDEYDYLDGAHAAETASYLVVEAGTYTLEDGTKLVAGNTQADHTFTSVKFGESFSSGTTVLTQVTSANEASAVTTRVAREEASGFREGFELRLQEEEAADGVHAAETVSYLAIDALVSSDTFQSDILPTSDVDNGVTLNYGSGFAAEPLLFAQIQSFNGTDTANLRLTSSDVNSASVVVLEEASADSELAHARENVGLLAIDPTRFTQDAAFVRTSEMATTSETGPVTPYSAEVTLFSGQLLLNDAAVTSLAQADDLLVSKQSEIIGYNASKISFAEQGGSVFEFFDTAAYADGLYEDRAHENAIHQLNGQIYLSAGQHTVDLEHDDGVRLSIAGQQIITDDYWDGSRTKTATFTVSEAGYYDIDLLFFEGGGASRLNLAIDGQVVDGANQNFVAPEYRTVAGNDIEAYGSANFVIAGDGDDRIRAGSLLNIATALAVEAANNSDDAFVQGAFGTTDGTLEGQETIGAAFTNLVGSLTNLGNVIVAGNGNNNVKAYGGANIIQTGRGNDQITAYGLGNAVVAGDGDNSLQLLGASNFVWGGNGNDEIQFIGDDNVYVLGDGYNRVTGFGVGGLAMVPGLGNIGNIIIGAGGVDDIVILGARNFLFLGGGDNFAIAIGNVNVIQGASGNDFFVGFGANNIVNAGDGDNFLVLGGLLNLVFTGSGNDVSFQLGTDNYGFYGGGDNRIFLGGERNIVLTGTGDDTVIAIAIPTVSLVIQAITGVELPTGNIAITGAGRDNVILLGKANIALTGADHDITILGGEYNFLLSGSGDDISLLAGKYNFAFFEGGDDLGVVLGETNVVFSGSGDDIVGVVGKTNVVFTGSGSDLLLVAGEFNFVVTDNELEFTTGELGQYLGEGDFNPFSQLKLENNTENSADSLAAYPYADLALFFPDIEFSNPDQPDYAFPTVTVPQVDVPIPDIPELKSAPEYKYGELGNYGLPTISLPTLSTPEFQIPGQSFPSIAIPDITRFNLVVENAGVNVVGSSNISSDFYGGSDAFARDFFGTNSSNGAPGTLFSTEFDATFYLSGESYGVAGYAQTENNLGVGDVDQLLDVNASNTGVEGVDQGTFDANLQGNYNLLDANARTENSFKANKDGTTYEYSADFSQGSVLVQSISGKQTTVEGTDTTAHNRIFIDGADTGASVNLTDDRTYELNVTYEATQVTGTEADDIIVYYNDEHGKQEIGRINPTAAGVEQTATFLFRAEASTKTDLSHISFESRYKENNQNAAITEIKSVDFVESDVSRIQLPTFSLPDLELPEFHLNGLDLSGLGVLDETIAGREFFGLTIPDFDIPEDQLVLPDFDLQDHVNTDEVRLDSLSYTIPAFNIPNIAGIKWDQRIGDYSHEYSLLQSQLVDAEENLVQLNPLETPEQETVYGDLAVVLGKENHVYSGRGDDAALLAGQKNFFYGGSDDDIGLLIGESNFGAFGSGNDIALAIGKSNNIDLKSGTDFGIIIGESNTLQGFDDNTAVLIGKENNYTAFNTFSGLDVVLSAGYKNTIITGFGNDTILSVGYENNINSGRHDDIVVALGVKNAVTLGMGSDFAVAAGVQNRVIGDTGGLENESDIIFTLGAHNYSTGGGGTDSLFTLGLANQVFAGGDDDLAITGGLVNASSLGDGNDVSVNFGLASFTTGGLGDDYLIDVGTGFATFGNAGNDTFLGIGYGFASGGADDDIFLSLGLGTIDAYLDAGSSILGDAIAGIISGLQQASAFFNVDDFSAPSNFLANQSGTVNQGGAGDDVFFSGFGRSVAIGGTGDDSYIYTLGSGELVISESTGTDAVGEIDSVQFNFDALNEALAAEDSEATIDRLTEVNTIYIETASADTTTQLTIDNLVLDQLNKEVNIVVDGTSVGRILYDGVADTDIIKLSDVDSSEQFTFAELKAHSETATATNFNAFDSAGALAAGLEETLAYLQNVEAADAETTELGRELSTGEFAAVAEVYDDLYNAKAAVDQVVSNKTSDTAIA